MEGTLIIIKFGIVFSDIFLGFVALVSYKLPYTGLLIFCDVAISHN